LGGTTKISLFGQQFSVSKDRPGELEEFRKQFALLIWFTYRKGFPRIGAHLSFAGNSPFAGLTQFQSDSGWGCMLRCGQMILASAMLRAQTAADGPAEPIRERIISFFADSPECPFSIHQARVVCLVVCVMKSRNIQRLPCEEV
jgi:hypothetical protein